MNVQDAPTTSRQSVIDVLRSLLGDAVRFAKAELSLVKAEGKEAAVRGIKGVVMLIAAGLSALLLIIFLFGAAAEAIGGWLGHEWLGWLIVAGFFLILTAALALLGIRRVKSAINEGKDVSNVVKEEALEAQVGTLESRVREELDWKAKLRRNGPRYAVIGGVAVIAVAGIIVLRVKFGKKEEKVDVKVSNLDDIAKELQQLRDELDKRKGKDSGPLWQKLGLRIAAAGAAAGGTLAARRLMERYAPEAADSHDDPGKEAGKAARAAAL